MKHPSVMAQRLGDPLALIWMLLCLAYLATLGAAPLFDVDEGAFAEASREMLASHDWGHTTLNGTDRFDKPILIYWLQAAAMAVFGINEWAVRLPSALCALAAAWWVGRYAERAWGAAVRWPATFLLATSLGYAVIGRAATADALLNMLLALTGLRLWRFAQEGRVADLRWACWWAGWGLLAKGPVAVLVPGAALFFWSLSTDHGLRLRQALADWLSWLIVLGVAAPWYGYALWRHGQAFIDGFFLRHNLERFSGPMEGHGGSLLYYLLVLPLLWLPWTLLLALLLRHIKPLWQDHSRRFLLIWAGFVVVFFSLSSTKLPHYVLYGSAPLALLMASVWQQHGAGRALRLGLAGSVMLLLLLTTGLTLGAGQLGALLPDPWLAGLLASAPSAALVLWAGVAVLLGLLALGVSSGRQRPVATASWRQNGIDSGMDSSSGVERSWRLWLAAVIGMAHFTLLVVPWWGQALQGPMREAGLWAKTQTGSTVQWQLHQPSFAFYRQQAAERRGPAPGELALVRLDRLPVGVTASVLFANRGLAVVRLPASAPASASSGTAP